MTNGKVVLVAAVAAAAMVLAVLVALRFAGRVTDLPLAGGPASGSRAEMEQVVHDYLIKNPEVIVEAMNGYQAKESEREISRMREGAKKNETELYREADPIVAGNPNGDVTMVEFFDYHCPYCKKVRDE